MNISLRDQAACIACRIGLAYAVGDLLLSRVELNTPLHSLISIREGLFWKQVGRSPYTGSAFRGPPLLLHLCQLTAKHHVWQASILSLVDWITSCVLAQAVTHAVRLSKQDNAGVLVSSSNAVTCCARTSSILCCRAHLHQTSSKVAIPGQPLPDLEHFSRMYCQFGKSVCYHSTVWWPVWQYSPGRLGTCSRLLPVCSPCPSAGMPS